MLRPIKSQQLKNQQQRKRRNSLWYKLLRYVILTQSWRLIMITLERLKRDQREAFRYTRRLKKKGKDSLSYKAHKKALVRNQSIRELQTIGG